MNDDHFEEIKVDIGLQQYINEKVSELWDLWSLE
jgi:hypothetical protein